MPNAASLANLKPAWQPGESGYAGYKPTGLRRVLSLARKNSPAAMQAVIDCLHDADARVRMAAAIAILDRAWGKPKEHVSFDGTEGMNIVIVTGVPRTDDTSEQVATETTYTIEYDAGEEDAS
jgi:hypothetical protein